MTTYTVHRAAYHSPDDRLYTCYCAMPTDPRGQYDEEIDVLVSDPRGTPSMTRVRACAQAELAANYQPGMAVRRVLVKW